MAMYGASVGNLAISNIDACTNQACCNIKSTNDVAIRFLYYWLNFCKQDFLAKAEGGGQPNISQNKIRNQIIFFPLVGEQQQITEFLDSKCFEIDNAIIEKKKQLTILDNYKKSLIYEYVTGKKEVPTNV